MLSQNMVYIMILISCLKHHANLARILAYETFILMD